MLGLVHRTLDIMLYLGARLQPALYPNEHSNEMHYEVTFVCCRCHSNEEVITSHHIIPYMNAMRARNHLTLWTPNYILPYSCRRQINFKHATAWRRINFRQSISWRRIILAPGERRDPPRALMPVTK